MKEKFGILPSGEKAYLYTISGSGLTAVISDLGATIVKLFVPDSKGQLSDVVLGFDKPEDYIKSGTYFGAVVGRNANRVGTAGFTLNGRRYELDKNDNGANNLHSGFAPYKNRIWEVVYQEENALCLRLNSPDGDQGFPGNATVQVTYTLDHGSLHIVYDAISDKDTVFNLTNHAYFNLAGHEHPEKMLDQIMCMPARFYTVADAASIPTGENRSVDGTPFDFREPKPIGQDICREYDSLKLQNGYDHNFEVFANPCAIVRDPESGRSMAVTTDCPGVQFYTGNFLKGETGKGGVSYTFRGGFCLETQFYPDSVNHPEWPQPFTRAGERYHSETTYRFTW